MKGPLLSRLQRSKLRLVPVALAVVATIACVTAGTVPASAASHSGSGAGGPAPAISDPIAVIGALAPDLLAQTRQPATAEQTASVEAQTGHPGLRIDVPADPSAPIALTPAETEGAGLPVSIGIVGASGQAVVAQGITSYAQGDQGRASSFVQPLANGVRLLTALGSPDAGESFSYDVGLPEGFTATPVADGLTLLATAEGRYIGTLGAAWATDASGTPLETSYEWSGSTLTQHVVLSADTAYPVLLDPTWYYDYDFSAKLPGYHARYPKAHDWDVDSLLHRCFNCSFPISGASRAYPVDGAVMNLNASPFSLVKVPAPVRVQTVSGGAMQFVATYGHFDGGGSTITFSWYNDAGGYLHLFVHAMVMVDRGPVINAANAQAAGVAWLTFWQRVADTAGGGSGGV
ncbi:MAG: hypothetical protein EPO52_14960 [Herbiconiux sp.]|uniref:hypothetical protein n=1 Tax=Herbiconiux sp. TaxID=1871186 RepID=UPI00122AD409|nr:hypothetical protein [Herbiconiux sp.]TAJ46834.1 MAG: hypothetical protein EPO52_14960 [Herbiconiux sp.]